MSSWVHHTILAALLRIWPDYKVKMWQTIPSEEVEAAAPAVQAHFHALRTENALKKQDVRGPGLIRFVTALAAFSWRERSLTLVEHV